jgi:hypothetical protein
MFAYPGVVSFTTPPRNDLRSASVGPSVTSGFVKPGPCMGGGADELGNTVEADADPAVHKLVTLV